MGRICWGKGCSFVRESAGVCDSCMFEKCFSVVLRRSFATKITHDCVKEARKTRNLGIIAHIDAGKTTTTERMLYYSGYIPRIGDVDQGNTVMDYLPAERERGITIQSAAITFPWREHRLNLIDTPGHADFTFEVERSLRVLDGAVAILDAVAGVEAQTEKVWRQANRRQIPMMVFINKMDRTGAGFGRTVREIAAKLGARPIVLQLPIFQKGLDEGEFLGVVDLLTLQCLEWVANSNGKEVTITSLDQFQNQALVSECFRARQAIVETLSEFDEDVVDAYLEYEDASKIPVAILKKSIRKLCLSNNLVPTLTGASFRNIGVQPLLDAVIDYLPSPVDRPTPAVVMNGHASTLAEDAITCALAFKVIIDHQRGPMVFVRVYKGQITRGTTLFNTTSKTKERAMKILQMYADEAREVEAVGEGNIAVILGLKDTKTGDTLILSKDSKHSLRLEPIDIPPPVFISTLETNSTTESKALELALESLLREDPSLRVSYDEETGQTLLSGMGELHLEIAGHRLLNDFKAKAEIGKLRIGYRESVDGTGTLGELFERVTGALRASVFLQVTIGPCDESTSLVDGNQIDVTLPAAGHANFSTDEVRLAIQNGVSAALSRGLLLGYPIHHARVQVSIAQYEGDSTLGALSGASRAITQKVMQQVGQENMSLLEPIMAVAITVDESNLGAVMNDLTGSRGGQVLSLEDPLETESTVRHDVYAPPDSTLRHAERPQHAGNTRSIHALVPLAEMVGYSRALRTLTGGRASFTMSVSDFKAMTQRNLQQLRQSLGSF